MNTGLYIVTGVAVALGFGATVIFFIFQYTIHSAFREGEKTAELKFAKKETDNAKVAGEIMAQSIDDKTIVDRLGNHKF